MIFIRKKHLLEIFLNPSAERLMEFHQQKVREGSLRLSIVKA